MKDYRAEESRVYGMLGVAGIIVLALVVWLARPMDIPQFFIMAFALYQLVMMARRGLGAAHLSTDGENLLVMRRREKLVRLPVNGVMSVTCGASVYDLRVLKVEHDTGETIRTLVREKDITSFMSQMPERALSIYWRELIGSGRTHF